MNKRQAQYYDSYVNSTAVYLEQVYKTCSARKHEEYRKCLKKHNDDIYKYKVVNPLRIISHCRDFFSVAWTVETDEALLLHVITPTKELVFEVALFV